MNNERKSAVIAFAFAVLPAAAIAQTVVVGQSDRTLDIAAVKAAVEVGGSVLLRGRFDFGEAGRILLEKDVEISGEVDASGRLLTIISGGEWTFFTPPPPSAPAAALPHTPPGPKVAIHHLQFVGARGTAIHLAHSGGALIHHNLVREMRARTTSTGVKERAAIAVGPGLFGGAYNTLVSGPGPVIDRFPRLVSGDIEIADNDLDTSGPEPTFQVRATGMFVSMSVGADVRILRNVVTGNTRTGLAIQDGIADAAGRGSLVIADNVIASDATVGFTQGLGPRAPIGMVTGFNNNRDLGANPELPTIPVLIEGNHVELHGVTSMGIINIWNGAVLRGNTIVIHADPAGTKDRLSTSGGIFATTSRQVLMHNRIVGEGCNAIRFGASSEGGGRYDNVAIGNDISGFSAFVGGFDECVDYWLASDSHDNTIVGNSGSVIDLGTHNKITGLRPVRGGVGGAVSAAAKDAAEVSQDLGYGFD